MASISESFNYAGGTDADWITLVYRQCLGRSPTPSDLAYWAAYSQTQVMQAIVGPPGCAEYQSDIIKADYNLFLNRNPQASDTSYWQGEFGTGLTHLQFDGDLISSGEYQSEPQAASGGNAVLWKWG